MRLLGIGMKCDTGFNTDVHVPVHLIPGYDVSLLQGLDGVHGAALLVLRQQHLEVKQPMSPCHVNQGQP